MYSVRAGINIRDVVAVLRVNRRIDLVVHLLREINEHLIQRTLRERVVRGFQLLCQQLQLIKAGAHRHILASWHQQTSRAGLSRGDHSLWDVL